MYLLIATLCAGMTCMEAEWQVEPTTAIPHNCMAALNERAPQWLMKHPGFTVRRFKCVPADRVQRDI